MNIVTTDDKQIRGAGTETGWITVESKIVNKQQANVGRSIRSDSVRTDGTDGNGFVLVKAKKIWKTLSWSEPDCAAIRDQDSPKELNCVSKSFSQNNPVGSNGV